MTSNTEQATTINTQLDDLTLDLARLIQLDAAVFAVEELGIKPDEWQERALTSKRTHQIYNCSRQSGKTETAAIRALHTACAIPESLTLLLSPSLRQSGELFRRVKLMHGNMRHPPVLEESSKLALTTETQSRILSLPGSEGTVRGFAAPDLIIIDEDAQVTKELFDSVNPMQATNPDGVMILMSTPYGRRGHFFEIWDKGREELWEKFQIDADECPRIGQAFLEQQQDILTPDWFRQEYYCEFLDLQGSLFSAEDILAAFSDTDVEDWDNPYAPAPEDEVENWEDVFDAED